MTNQQILTRAIKKAIKNGWTVNDWTDCNDFEWNVEGSDYEGDDSVFMHFTGLGEEFWFNLGNLILDHDFAKALWGTEPNRPINVNTRRWTVNEIMRGQANWLYHLQEIVMAEDPMKYLGENI